MSKFCELKNKNCSTVRLFALPDADSISDHQKQYYQWAETTFPMGRSVTSNGWKSYSC